MCEIISAATMASMTGISSAAAFTALDAVALIGTISSVTGAYSQSSAQQDQFSYQAAVDRNNATIRERQAKDVVKRGELDANREKLKGKFVHDRALVTLAGQGGDVTTGTSVDLLADIKEGSKKDEKQTENNAAREANAILADASNQRANASLHQLQSDSINPLFSAGSTAIAGLGSVGSQWYKRS